jgi:hypothetical protein
MSTVSMARRGAEDFLTLLRIPYMQRKNEWSCSPTQLTLRHNRNQDIEIHITEDC